MSRGACGGTTDDDCERICTLEYAPICDSEGTTHSNNCAFETAQCKARKQGKRLSIASQGECGGRPRPGDDCERTCTYELDPVCDSEGAEHPNNCAFEIAQCKARKAGKAISIAKRGKCQDEQPDECARECTLDYSPICDSEGTTHSNYCGFEIALCRARKQGKSIRPISRGECEGDKPGDDCEKSCTREYLPVCDNEGTTHSNNCAFEIAQCKARKNGKTLSIASQGECGEKPKDDCDRECSLDYSPICDSDGKTHSNYCGFEIALCRARKAGKSLRPVSRGECEGDKPGDDCEKSCTREYSPVCDSEGTTHSNNCAFEIEQCKARKQGKNLRVVSQGACPDKPKDNCNQACPLDLDPVCDSVGTTHANLCVFEAAQCNAKKVGQDLQIASRGKCGEGGQGGDDDCDRVCTQEYAPVCDNEGTTHGNNCAFEVANCKARKAGKILAIIASGPCSGPVPNDDCDKPCTRDYAPVCDSDGKTHANICGFEIAECKARKQGKRLTVAKQGECDDEEVCNQACTLEYDPICGSDGITHGNPCAFESAQCEARKEGRQITMVNRGECATKPTGSCDRPCPLILNEVCDNEGVTHGNPCVFEVAQCRAKKQGRTLSIAKRGNCES